MKKLGPLSVTLAVAALVFTGAAFAHAGHMDMDKAHHGKSVTVSGEIVDLSCFLAHDGRGAAHKKCAEICLNKGFPMGIVTKSGALYLLVADHDNNSAYAALKAKAAATVTVTGSLYDKDGLKAIAVASSK